MRSPDDAKRRCAIICPLDVEPLIFQKVGKQVNNRWLIVGNQHGGML
jgi:hypothetical protein